MNYYQLLGVKETASQKEIKDAYKKLIKKYHPDIYVGDKNFAEKKTKEINLAYDTLSDEKQKKLYDEELHPTPTYNYTPPKYNNPESYSYHHYYKNTDYDNNFRRYTKYHQSKTPNSNYHDQISNNIINSFSKFSLSKKLLLIFLFVIIYFVFLISTFFKFNSFFHGNTNTKQNINTKIETPSKNTTIIEEPDTYEDFDINDYFSEDELKSIYNEYYKGEFDSYNEFKETISDYLYYYLYSN